MGNRRLKFGVGIAILAAAVLWLGMSGYDEGKQYYKNCDEYLQMTPEAQASRIRLRGNVVAGSIHRDQGRLAFALALNDAVVPVVYHGTDPVPDTFKDGVDAMVDGSRGADGRFVGRQIQAKCASKYEVDPKAAYGQAQAPHGDAAAAAP